MSQNKKLGTINMNQHTPVGDDQSATNRIYLITVVYNEADFVTFKDLQKIRSEGTPVNVIGYYEIVHPEIMAGTWSQMISEFCSMAEVQADKDGLIEYADNGGVYLIQ